MSYFAVDDEMPVHPKMVPLSLAAVGLWVRCGAWAKKYRTGGHVTLGAIRTLGGNRKLALELCKVQPGEERGVWIETEDGFQFHDWEEYQLRGLAQTPKEKQAAYRAREKAKKEEAARLMAEAESRARYHEGNGSGNGSGNESSNGSVDNVTCLPARAHAHGGGGGVGNSPSSTEDAQDPRHSYETLPNRNDLATAFHEARVAANGPAFRLQFSQHKAADGVIELLAEQADPWAAMETMLHNFIEAGWTEPRGFTWGDFAGSDPGRWLAAQPKSAPKGPAKAPTFEAFPDQDPNAPLLERFR